jgi:uncharacterized phage infection (PIP) family protein YhgE
LDKKEDIFFVEVHESEEVRRNVLESLKDIVENLQRFEKFKEIKRKKVENINKLGKIMKDINKIIPKLKTSLPDTKIRSSKRKDKEPEIKTVVKKTPKEIAKRKPVTELQKLESELGEIEDKLSSLR